MLKLLKDVEAAPVFQRLAVIKSALIRYHTELQEKSGVYSNVRLSSG
ncbi:MAG: hypothetical protein HC933_13465, partial [Pleurocapsa sp. SU_196_0]|nr:hypothetical protein [Pleurocapsa sp. SU_196_0]